MMVSLEEFLKYMLKKWKLVIAIVVLCTVTFTASIKLFHSTVVNETNTLSEYYSVQVELYEDIVENENAERLNEAFFDNKEQNKELYDHFTEELKLAPISYMETVTIKSAVVFGAIVGCILAVAVIFAKYVKENNIQY